jgi:hypothetical protein
MLPAKRRVSDMMSTTSSLGINRSWLDMPGALALAILYLELRHHRPDTTVYTPKRDDHGPHNPDRHEQQNEVDKQDRAEHRLNIWHEAPPFCGERSIAQ